MIRAYDTETHLIQPGLLAPPLVCGSVASVAHEELLDADAARVTFQELLASQDIIVGANIAYDMGVHAADAEAYGLDLLPAIFRAYDQDRVYDVLIAQALDAIAGGHLFQDPRTQSSLRDPQTGKSMDRYSLAVCCDLVLGLTTAKENDYWRLRYALLADRPIADWPEIACQYPIDDARNTLDVALGQLDMTRTELGVPDAEPGPNRHRNLHDIHHQTRAAFALHLGAIWGLRTDRDRVEALAQRVDATHAAIVAKFRAVGYVDATGKESQSMVKRAVARAYGASGTCPVCRGTGKIPSVKNPKSQIICKPKAGGACDGTGLDLDTAPVLPRTPTGGVSADRDTLMESGDETLEAYGANEDEKIRDTYVPFLREGLERPINLRPNVLVASGRTSYAGLIQLLTRQGGVRECFKARAGYVYCSVDYSALELCLAGSTRILTELGYKPIRELVGRNVRVASKFSDDHSFNESNEFHDAVVFSTGVQDTVRIVTIDGRCVECTKNHPLLTQTATGRRGLSYSWRVAGDVRVGDALVVASLSISVEPPMTSGKFYTFGHFAGDGWFCTDSNGRVNLGVCSSGSEGYLLTTVLPFWEQLLIEAESFIESKYDNRYQRPLCIKKGKSHFSESATDQVKKKSPGVLYLVVYRPQVARLLRRKYGFKTAKAPDKRFPACYWGASVDEKRSFLRGLLDADGTVCIKQRYSVALTAANELFARDAQMALSEFGVESRLTTAYLTERSRSQTILFIRGVVPLSNLAKEVWYIDSHFPSRKAERLAGALPQLKTRNRRRGSIVRLVEYCGSQDVYNLEVKDTRNYIAEGLVLHNCTLAQVCLWVVGWSRMAETINATGDPGMLHTALAASMAGVSTEELAAAIKAGDTRAKNLRQAAKPANFGLPGGMGAAKLVLSKRKKSEGTTTGPDGRNYAGIRFCILIGGAETCGSEKVTEWKRRPTPPICKACVELVEHQLKPAWFAQWPEVREYFQWVNRNIEVDGALECFVSKRVRGGLDFTSGSNNGFQALAADGGKRALWLVTREAYTDRRSPLWGTRPISFIHDEIFSEMPELTAHLAAPRKAELMISGMREYVPDVTIKAEPALCRYWYKDAEPVYRDGRLIPWEPKEPT